MYCSFWIYLHGILVFLYSFHYLVGFVVGRHELVKILEFDACLLLGMLRCLHLPHEVLEVIFDVLCPTDVADACPFTQQGQLSWIYSSKDHLSEIIGSISFGGGLHSRFVSRFSCSSSFNFGLGSSGLWSRWWIRNGLWLV